MTHRIRHLAAGLALLFALVAALPAIAADPLASWNDGAAKQSILDFVAAATRAGGPGFIAPAERIAVFDNDGTLWAEQPVYFQLAFAFDRIRALAPQNPRWKTTEPFASILASDIKTALAGGEKAIAEMVMATHAGMTTDEFAKIVAEWVATAKHPRFDRPYTEVVYQPMLELLAYLRANGFKTYIVSGGGADFMRSIAREAYGIPTWQVIGSEGSTKYEVAQNGTAALMKTGGITFIDDNVGKPVGIETHIGQRPIFAAGNSDGDFQMLEWTTSGDGPRFGLIVHHTDAKREFAYDRDSPFGKLARGLDEAAARGWTVVDMANDWSRVWAGRP